MSGQGGRQMVADEMFPDGPGGGLDYVDPEDGVKQLIIKKEINEKLKLNLIFELNKHHSALNRD